MEKRKVLIKSMFFTVILAVLLICSSTVYAGPSGAYIIPGCEQLLAREDSSPEAGYCAGVLNTIMTFAVAEDLICFPEGTSTPDLVPAILLWKAQPGSLDRDFIGLAIIALTIEFPCSVDAPSNGLFDTNDL
jgi:hypothetical protein